MPAGTVSTGAPALEKKLPQLEPPCRTVGLPCAPTILLAEDNVGVRRVTVKHLTALGYDVVTAANGEEALALLAKVPRVELF